MSQLSPIAPSSQPFLRESRSPIAPRATHLQCESSISSEKAGYCTSLWNVVLAPFKFIGGVFASIGKFIMDYLCCCCACGSYANTIDYEKTRNLVEQICTCLDPASGKDDTYREKTYGHARSDLSLEALDELRHQLGLLAAAEYSPDALENEVDREQYYQEHKAELKIEDLLQDPSNPLLLEAFKIYLAIVEAKLGN
ncbi:MAG: hypothetical protein K940chlam2_01580 [Chlamydiae bacterium]|nr:hypothetical protein [Chlamydiota bacterium]